MDSPFPLVVDHDPDPRDLALLEEKLADAATEAVGAGDEHEFAVLVRDDDGEIRAGVSGTMWGGCCQIHVLWVDAALRARGLARSSRQTLVMAPRAEADFTRPDTVGAIEDCPADTTTRWCRKDL